MLPTIFFLSVTVFGFESFDRNFNSALMEDSALNWRAAETDNVVLGATTAFSEDLPRIDIDMPSPDMRAAIFSPIACSISDSLLFELFDDDRLGFISGSGRKISKKTSVAVPFV